MDQNHLVTKMASAQYNNSSSSKNAQQKEPKNRLDEDLDIIEMKFDNWTINNLSPDNYINKSSSKDNALGLNKINALVLADNVELSNSENNILTDIETNSSSSSSLQINGSDNICCTYCTISFTDRSELRAHCQTENHQNIIMSDEGKQYFIM